jgi:hypothetical protein
MARGRKTGGRQKGARNRATDEACAAAAASGILPLDYMLSVMRDPAADHKRRDAMAMAAAPYLHPKLTAMDAKLSPAAGAAIPEEPSSIRIEFVVPNRHYALEDQE